MCNRFFQLQSTYLEGSQVKWRLTIVKSLKKICFYCEHVSQFCAHNPYSIWSMVFIYGTLNAYNVDDNEGFRSLIMTSKVKNIRCMYGYFKREDICKLFLFGFCHASLCHNSWNLFSWCVNRCKTPPSWESSYTCWYNIIPIKITFALYKKYGIMEKNSNVPKCFISTNYNSVNSWRLFLSQQTVQTYLGLHCLPKYVCLDVI